MHRAVTIFCWLLASARGKDTKPYELGEEFRIQCRDKQDKWGEFLHCSETSSELTFKYGVDSFIYCGWSIDTQEKFEFIKSVVQQNEAWQCRLAMSSDKAFYLPVSIPLWGLVEANSIHINYHMSFVFHGDQGKILGATIYPVRDRFQLAKVGSVVNLHGPVRWFQRHSFKSMNAGLYAEEGLDAHGGESIATTARVDAGCLDTLSLIGASVFIILLCTTTFAVVYLKILKPRLVKKYLKSD